MSTWDIRGGKRWKITPNTPWAQVDVDEVPVGTVRQFGVEDLRFVARKKTETRWEIFGGGIAEEYLVGLPSRPMYDSTKGDGEST